MMQEVDKVWEKFDADGSGKLSKTEAEKFLSSALEEMLGRKPTQDDIDQHFNMMDTDGSGDIDKLEAMTFLVSFR